MDGTPKRKNFQPVGIRLIPCEGSPKRKAQFFGQLTTTHEKSPLDPVVFHPYVEWKSPAAV